MFSNRYAYNMRCCLVFFSSWFCLWN